MTRTMKAGLAAALAVAAATLGSVPALAADLHGGSLKDTYAPVYAPAPAAASPCYLRSDIGYSWNTSLKGVYEGNGTDPDVRLESLRHGTVSEVGIGCSSGSRGLRGDLTLGFRLDREFAGDVDIVVNNNPLDPPIKSKLDTYTVMLNAYYDFGSWRGFVPYLGAGLGLALHDMDKVTIEHPGSPNPQHGDTKVSAAWALMAGVGYQLAPNAIVDVGYRYISLGSAHSSQGDVVQFMNPKLVLSDMAAHEFKVGIRYHFGQTASPHAYAPFK